MANTGRDSSNPFPKPSKKPAGNRPKRRRSSQLLLPARVRRNWPPLRGSQFKVTSVKAKNTAAAAKKPARKRPLPERVPPVLMDSTRDNTQMLINAVCELLTERDEEAVGANMHVRRQFYPVPGAPAPKPLTFF
ncbi:uncharacterized protein LOC128092388 [Culex pipiens pallens]|uniref:uncharacterized protein LOC128092388 n=1 Tax=Culex pipiens pallens TaxID=42434 RepID=UPI0022AAD0F0|nr:uncharacterized protein LOC128092388 [Culex pipiens pallens]